MDQSFKPLAEKRKDIVVFNVESENILHCLFSINPQTTTHIYREFKARKTMISQKYLRAALWIESKNEGSHLNFQKQAL